MEGIFRSTLQFAPSPVQVAPLGKLRARNRGAQPGFGCSSGGDVLAHCRYTGEEGDFFGLCWPGSRILRGRKLFSVSRVPDMIRVRPDPRHLSADILQPLGHEPEDLAR